MEQKSIRDYPKAERVFFENDKDEIQYNKTCLACANCMKCGQSFRTSIISCHNNIKCKTPEQYLHEIKKQKKDIKDISKTIGINSRTVNSMLNERQDISFELHKGLMKELFGVEIK